MADRYYVAAADHPSLAGDIDGFVDALSDERRYFGPTARCAPKPSRALLSALSERDGVRLLAFEGGAVVGAVRIDAQGEMFIAVAAAHRGRGVGYLLAETAIGRASVWGHEHVVLRTTPRARSAHRLGVSLGARVFGTERGRLELVIDVGRRHAAV